MLNEKLEKNIFRQVQNFDESRILNKIFYPDSGNFWFIFLILVLGICIIFFEGFRFFGAEEPLFPLSIVVMIVIGGNAGIGPYIRIIKKLQKRLEELEGKK